MSSLNSIARRCHFKLPCEFYCPLNASAGLHICLHMHQWMHSLATTSYQSLAQPLAWHLLPEVLHWTSPFYNAIAFRHRSDSCFLPKDFPLLFYMICISELLCFCIGIALDAGLTVGDRLLSVENCQDCGRQVSSRSSWADSAIHLSW